MTTTDDLNALLTIHDGDVFRPDFGDGESGTGLSTGLSRTRNPYRGTPSVNPRSLLRLCFILAILYAVIRA